MNPPKSPTAGADLPVELLPPSPSQRAASCAAGPAMDERSMVDLAELRELVGRCQAGHSSAVREFIARYEGPVFGLCYRMLAQRQDAEDMAQETFVRAVRHLHQWDCGRDILPWLLAIAGNRCRSLLATRKRRPVNTELFEVAAEDSHHDSAAELLREELQLALARLRPEYARAFVLFHERELPYESISHLLEVPLGTIKTWIHRARKELVQTLRAREALNTES
jgi:RNA polymerase sigma-70 factor, ECF subfamily